ncbi:SIS domain-containing protein [Deinococcus deserti]|nr:hypothetical protein [Deinococcus deserti]
MNLTHECTGLQLIERERERQFRDALDTLDSNREMARQVAGSIRRTGQVLLLGMGASHHANLVATAALRALGIEAFAMPLSEALYVPLPERPRTVLLTSQSGGSVEAERYLHLGRQGEDYFGLTLNPDSLLACAVPCLVAAGGSEQGFAATRSYLLTLALHSTIAKALGDAQEDFRAVVKAAMSPDVTAAVDHLRLARSFVFSARGGLQGVAEVGALGILELAHVPAFALEGGQLRHGPMEAVKADLGMIFLRDAAHRELIDSLIRACQEAGVVPVVLDVSGEAPQPGRITISAGRHQGLAAAAALCEPLQKLLLAVAGQRVERVGEPVRSSKVTRTE